MQALQGNRHQMKKTLSFMLLYATLVFFWIWLNNAAGIVVLSVGLVSSLIIALIFSTNLSAFSGLKPNLRAIAFSFLFILYFIKELFKSNLSLAKIVLSPGLPLNPGIVKVRTRLKSPMARLLLANSITLTPGTLTVEMTGEWLYVHCVTLESDNIEAATASIVAGFERYLMVMYD
jgi:multicomponent Na+:H+ antiporter subunit E